MFNNEIIKKIQDLKNNKGAYALKASFEDEGISDSDLSDLILLSNPANIRVYVKIGGCEANRDIEECLRLGIKGIVAPMVESEFAVSKFIDSIEQRISLFGTSRPKIFINIESIEAVKRSKKIFEKYYDKLDGIVVGRSDLSKSMGLGKKYVNSAQVMLEVKKVLENAKNHDLITKMGGTVSAESATHIMDLHAQGLLDFFETRAVIYEIPKLKNIVASISSALEYEQLLLENRIRFHHIKAGFFENRKNNIERRK